MRLSGPLWAYTPIVPLEFQHRITREGIEGMERKRQLPGPDGNPLHVEEDSTGDQDAPQAGEAESDDHPGSALDRLVASWAEIAVSHAAVRYIDDPSGHVATVAGIEGAWGFGDSEERALDELRSVLIGWACLKLEDGDDDIPSMEGVHLVVKR